MGVIWFYLNKQTFPDIYMQPYKCYELGGKKKAKPTDGTNIEQLYLLKQIYCKK